MPFKGVPSINTCKKIKVSGVLNVLRKAPDGCPNFPFSYLILLPGYPARSGKEQMHRKMKNGWENTYKNSCSDHFAMQRAQLCEEYISMPAKKLGQFC